MMIYIHANDIQGRAQESLDIVRSYDAIAPRNPHALHMPTHIFTRLGYWQEVIEGNHQAASKYYGALLELGDGESNRPRLEEARIYMSGVSPR